MDEYLKTSLYTKYNCDNGYSGDDRIWRMRSLNFR